MDGQPEVILCDFIGCRQTAAWRRSETLAGSFSELLCEVHYEQLWQTNPLIATHYSSIGLPLQETEETAVVAAPQSESEQADGARECPYLAVRSYPYTRKGRPNLLMVPVEYCAIVGDLQRHATTDELPVFYGPTGELVERQTCKVARYERSCRLSRCGGKPQSGAERPQDATTASDVASPE